MSDQLTDQFGNPPGGWGGQHDDPSQHDKPRRQFVVVEVETTSVYGPFETYEAGIDYAFDVMTSEYGGDEDYEAYLKTPQSGPWPKSKEDFLRRLGQIVTEMIDPTTIRPEV